MTKHTTVFASMLRHLSRSEFESAVSGYNGDFKIRTLSCWDLFKSMLYAFISNCFSVREIETSMRANGNRLYHSGLKQIKRSTFCNALERRQHDLFKSVFHKLTDKVIMMKSALLTKNSLIGLCTNISDSKPPDSLQPSLEGFIC